LKIPVNRRLILKRAETEMECKDCCGGVSGAFYVGAVWYAELLQEVVVPVFLERKKTRKN
jgi:hypothetical protein